MKIDLKKSIKAHGFTLAAVAERLGVPRSQMSKITTGNPTINTLEAVADVMGITLAELLADTTTPPPHAITCPHCGASLTVTLS